MAYFSEPLLVQRQMCYSTRASHSHHLHYLCIILSYAERYSVAGEGAKIAAKVCKKQWKWSYEELLHTLLPSLQVRRKRMKLILLYRDINNMAYFSEPPLVQRQMCHSTRASHSHYLSGHACQYLSSFFPNQYICRMNYLPPFNVVTLSLLLNAVYVSILL